MRDQQELFRFLVRQLQELEIDFMICGSVASSVLGEPRMTADVDLVIDPEEEPMMRLVCALNAAGLYADEISARRALGDRSMFNVIDPESGFKADLFSRTEFDRRQTMRVWQLDVPVTSAEDLILSKLEWSKKSSSERQFRDALGVATISKSSLDQEYLTRWADSLGVEDLLQRLRSEVDANR